MILTQDEKQLLYWQLAVEGMDVLDVPENGYDALNKTNVYDRFNTFAKEFSGKILFGKNTELSFFDNGETPPAFDESKTKDDWWEQLSKLGGGKLSSAKDLPEVNNLDKKDITATVKALMPAYKAIKDSFDRRPFWHWITRHDQYVAERDTLKALRGAMMLVTGQTSAYVDQKLVAYSNDVRTSGYSREQRKELIANMRNGEKLTVYDNKFEEFQLEKERDEIENDFANAIEDRDANFKGLKRPERKRGLEFREEDVIAIGNGYGDDNNEIGEVDGILNENDDFDDAMLDEMSDLDKSREHIFTEEDEEAMKEKMNISIEEANEANYILDVSESVEESTESEIRNIHNLFF